jgi:hypothetical protein
VGFDVKCVTDDAPREVRQPKTFANWEFCQMHPEPTPTADAQRLDEDPGGRHERYGCGSFRRVYLRSHVCLDELSGGPYTKIQIAYRVGWVLPAVGGVKGKSGAWRPFLRRRKPGAVPPL